MSGELEIILNPDHIDLEPVIGLDLETSGLKAWEDKIRLIIISTSRNIYILDPDRYHQEFLTEVMESIRDCRAVVAHNAKFDCGFIYYHYGVLLKNWWCTLIASQIVVNGKLEFQGKHSLPEVIERFLKEKLEFSAKNKKLLQKSFTSQYTLDNFTTKQLRYASDDVKFLIPLHRKQQVVVAGLELGKIAKLENDLIPILAKMEVEGCLIDAVGWRKLINEYWIPDVERLEAALDKEVARLDPTFKPRRKANVISLDLFGQHTGSTISTGGINYGSQDQVISLFKKLGEEVPSVEIKDKEEENYESSNSVIPDSTWNLFGGDDFSSPVREEEEETSKESLDETVLSTYINERPNSRMKPFVKLLLEYRVATKRVSTYGEKFLAQLDKTSRIHTGYTQTFTATGRVSSKSPNLQNIPSPEKGKLYTDVRRFFKAKPGYKFITCDMEGAEIAIAADYSQEPILLESIRSGLDMHSSLSSVSYSIIFGQPVTISKSENPIDINGHKLIPVTLRDLHKSVVFAKFYKAGAKKLYGVLAEYINMFHPEEMRIPVAQKISKALDKKMPKLSKYLDNQIETAQREGYLRGSSLGRIRFFSKDVYGEAANLKIQNSNAEAIKMAMIRIHNYFESCDFDARLVMSIHDEVVCEVEEEYAEVAAEQVRKIMAESLSYFLTTIKGKASVKIGDCWEK